MVKLACHEYHQWCWTPVFELLFLSFGTVLRKSNHSMERSDILLYENQLRFVELLLTGNREVTL